MIVRPPERLSLEEWNLVAQRLDCITPVFYMMWKLGRPMFSDTTPTLCVGFDPNGLCIEFLVNRDFWGILDEEQRAFLIAHECMHVVLNHGIRIRSIIGKEHLTDIANRAMDIVVNEFLIQRCFSLSKLGDFKDKLCWIHTCFKNTQGILSGQNFEYYYNRLLKEPKDTSNKSGAAGGNGAAGGDGKTGGNSPMVLDDHKGLWDKNAKWEELKDFFDQVASGCTPQQVEEFVNSIANSMSKASKSDGAGNGSGIGNQPGGGFLIVKLEHVKKKKKWETVIKKWANRYLKEADKDHEQWARLNRRFQLMDGNMFIPTEIEIEDINEDEKKIEVWFFQDTSGSCKHLAPRFFKAAKSLPANRFKVRMFCFDTRVYETSLESGKLYGFGGTTFSCIEAEIQKIINKEKIQYPKAVFVITDGAGDFVRPQFPKKWYWFLSYPYRSYIPTESKIYNLSDFE